VGELGLGTDHAVAVPSRGFRMDVASLEAELDRQQARGRTVMAQSPTSMFRLPWGTGYARISK